MSLEFTQTFKNSVGVVVAGIWLDLERHEWRVSTEPIRGFATPQDAITFFNKYCDHETGIPGSTPHNAELVHSLVKEVHRGHALRRQSERLAGELAQAVGQQNAALEKLKRGLARSDPQTS